MTANELVDVWAKWSRDLCSRWTDKSGAKVIVDHDAALARTRRELESLGATEAGALAGFVFATRFLSGEKGADPSTTQFLVRKLMVQAGLVAEAVANNAELSTFEAIVGQAMSSPVDSVIVAASGGALLGEYSCNAKGEVWPVVTFGHTPLEERTYLQGTDPLLDEIVEKVLCLSPSGGRFQVRDDGVFLARDLSRVV